MTAEEIHSTFITVPEIMADCETDRNTVYNWLKYHGYMSHESVLGKPVVRREEYARFKQKHPELAQAQTKVAA